MNFTVNFVPRIISDVINTLGFDSSLFRSPRKEATMG